MRILPAAGLLLLASANQAGAGLMTRVVDYSQDGATLRGYLAWDDAVQGKRPGVLIFPEWWGLVEFPKAKADQLARLGYVAFAADMFGEGRTTDDPQQAARLVGGLSPIQLRQRARAALDALRRQEQVDPGRIAAMGFCFGGKVALELAYSGADVHAVVTFHAELTPPTAEEARAAKAQILVCTGADDPMAPPGKIEAFWQALRETGLIWQINIYSAAQHSFTNPDADRHRLKGIRYNAVAAERSWNAMQQFFREVFARAGAAASRPSSSSGP